MKTDEQIKKEIEWENENETYFKEGPECPHCHYVHDDPEVKYIDEDGYEFMECHDCSKEFGFSMYVSHSWTSAPVHPEFNPKN